MRDPTHPRQFTEEFRRQIVALVDSGKPVSYTHLDVYKRQVLLNRRTMTAFASGCAGRRGTMHTEMNELFVEPRPP